MSKKSQHVVPRGNAWAVVGAGNSRGTAILNTQAAAISRAREMAINNSSEVVIHRSNAQIRGSNSYGNDPFPPKG